MRLAAALLAALVLPAAPALSQLPPATATLGPGVLASIVVPAQRPAVALAVLVPDAGGEQGRAEAYAEALARRGIASLVLGIEDQEGDHPSEAPAPGRAALDLARAWAAGQAPLLGGAGIAVIGFGAGARVALGVSDAPVVALDPGCRGLRLAPAPRPALLVHGLAAADAADCAGIEGAERLPLPGIGHGWDVPVVAAPGGALLPDPSGPGRRRARPDPIATAAVAEAVADWIEASLRGGGP